MSRQEDVRVEQVCGRFLDENFYSRLCCKFERNSVLSSQYLGVDVTVSSEAGEFIIDEKVKYYGTVNRAIEYPSFELTRLDGSGRRGYGWYLNRGQLTNAYLFVSPFLAEGDAPGMITDGNLLALQVLLVQKKSVERYVSDHGLSGSELLRRAEALAGGYRPNGRKKAYDVVRRDELWLTYSAGLWEKPVNLVVPRDQLRKLKGVVDLYVTRESIKRV